MDLDLEVDAEGPIRAHDHVGTDPHIGGHVAGRIGDTPIRAVVTDVVARLLHGRGHELVGKARRARPSLGEGRQGHRESDPGTPRLRQRHRVAPGTVAPSRVRAHRSQSHIGQKPTTPKDASIALHQSGMPRNEPNTRAHSGTSAQAIIPNW